MADSPSHEANEEALRHLLGGMVAEALHAARLEPSPALADALMIMGQAMAHAFAREPDSAGDAAAASAPLAQPSRAPAP